MNSNINSIMKKIKESIMKNDDNSLFEIEEEVQKIKDINNVDKSIISELLSLYEENPNFDFGMPGALTHFLESFYRNGYEEKLIESIHRKPTMHTLWMLNRIINGTNTKEVKKTYIQELNNLAKNHKLDKSIRDLAREYIALHKN